MAVCMNSVGLNQNTAFKGSHKRTDAGNPYYHTTAGTTAGAVLAVPAFLFHAKHFNKKEITPEIEEKMKKNYQESLENLKTLGLTEFTGKTPEEYIEKVKSNQALQKKTAIPFAVIAAGLTLGSGMLVDKIRNGKAKETADFAKQVGVKNAVQHGDSVAVSRKGNAYYESDTGKKYGALLGSLCGCAAWAMNYAHTKKVMIGINILYQVIPFALGGLIMGAIADHNTNKAAERKA